MTWLRKHNRGRGMFALLGALAFAFLSGPFVDQSQAGEPDLTRLVEFVKYVTPDGELPDLCARGPTDGDPRKAHICETCLAAANGAVDLPEFPTLNAQLGFATEPQAQIALSQFSAADVHAFRSRAPPVG
ncbi:MAG: hypothetical protein AAFR71_02790 [Pseudomonadota bacterium]